MARYAWVDDKIHRRKLAREAARSVLPNATEVKIVASANVRAWRTMLELRLGEGAELEIRRMAVACLRLLQREAPALFGDFEIYPAPTGARRDAWGFTRCEAFREGRTEGRKDGRRETEEGWNEAGGRSETAKDRIARWRDRLTVRPPDRLTA